MFDPTAYGPVFESLLATDFSRPIDKGNPSGDRVPELQALSVDAAFAHTSVVDRKMAACCCSGVWLLYDELDSSHTISQGIKTTTGSYWHGIMQRL